MTMSTYRLYPPHQIIKMRNEYSKEISAFAATNGVFSSSPEWCVENASPVIAAMTQELFDLGWVDELREKAPKHHAVVDARVQRLMPGMFPSIPGWHLDGVNRDGYYAQPDLSTASASVEHIVGTLSTHDEGVSLTRWAEETTVEIDMADGSVYQQMHKQLEHQIQKGLLNTFQTPDNHWARISQLSAHQATATHNRGWRVFYRLSMMPMPPIGNENRNIEQVYILSEENGW